nr:putative ribonuclease H-like domain-containing protein [Tanacetum cinerariifolium]
MAGKGYKYEQGNPQQELLEKGVINSGCSRHMTRNMSYLYEYEEIDGGYVAFELKFNLVSVSQMYDKKNSVLFTDTECVVLSPNFKLLDESQVLLRVPRKNNMYGVDLTNVTLLGGLTCLFAKATSDESNLWHMRLGHINFKTMNILVRGNLVRGLPLKIFENDHTCVACQKGKQHKASCKTKNGIGRGFSVGRTLQQNGVAERKNRTLIEATRTMLADSKLPTTFWAKAVNTAYYEMKGIRRGFRKMRLLMMLERKVLKFHERIMEFRIQQKKVTKIIKRMMIVESLVVHMMMKFRVQRQILTTWNSPQLTQEGVSSLNRSKLVEAMQDELLQFKLQKKNALIMMKVFAPVARIEAIRLFLAYESFMGFIVYQMDVKSAFLYGTIEEEVYVCQPPCFKDPHFPNKVYKVEKALYGLHQAPRAWYETLSTYLLENRFRRGVIDKTLFIKNDKDDILLVQVYVDDIIFGSTKISLCIEFEGLMHKKFQMSSMGELTFFLRLQVMQNVDEFLSAKTKRDELCNDIEQMCMQHVGPSYVAVASRMHFQRTAGLEQEINELKKKLTTCLRENANLHEELLEAYRIKAEQNKLKEKSASQNFDLMQQKIDKLSSVVLEEKKLSAALQTNPEKQETENETFK